jgi:CBS domain-containing protein
MSIEHILAEKGHTVITVEPERTLLETARLLTEKRIGAVVVGDADHPVLGIISERDIARAVGQRGAAALDEAVSQNMTTKLVTCTRSYTVSNLMELMTDQRIRHVPVVEDGRLSGIISIGDIVKHRLAELEAERRAMHDYTATEYSAGRF